MAEQCTAILKNGMESSLLGFRKSSTEEKFFTSSFEMWFINAFLPHSRTQKKIARQTHIFFNKKDDSYDRNVQAQKRATFLLCFAEMPRREFIQSSFTKCAICFISLLILLSISAWVYTTFLGFWKKLC